MKANTKRISLITLILTVALMFSLFSISVFAEAEESSTPAASESIVESTPAESTPAESTPAESTGSASTPAESSTPAASASASNTSGTDANTKDMTGTIISLSILGVIVIVITLFCIIKREKVGKFFRSLKSEFKKVVWLSWDQVRKNTIVVIIVVVIVAVVIGLLDIAFNQGIVNLGKLVK